MNPLPSKKVISYLDKSQHELQSLFIKIQALQKLNDKILPYLSPYLAHHAQIANLTRNKLIIFVANGSIATQLRFQTGDLLKKFSLDPELKHIHQIDCKVQPMLTQPISYPPSHQKKNMPLLSEQTAEIIRTMAAGLEDEQLREVMERIAKRTE